MKCTRNGSLPKMVAAIVLAVGLAFANRWEAAGDTAARKFAPETTVSIDGTGWRINGVVTYPGAQAEGLLMNVRMVNATFEDRNRDDFDPDANTAACLAVMPEGFGKPIVCNEDDKTGAEAAEARRLSVENGASYGLMLKLVNQYQPFEFHGVKDDPVFYGARRVLTEALEVAPDSL